MKLEPQFNSLPQMNADTMKRDKTLEKIAAAQQLSMEDSSARTIATMLQTQISTMSQGLMNANDGISMMQIADGTLSSLSDQTQSLNDLSVRYNNASINETQRQALNQEFSRTTESMSQAINSATYNGQPLFGSNNTFSLGENSLNVSIGSLSPASLSITDPNSIQKYAEQVSSTQSDVGSAMSGLISASNTILDQLSATAAAKSQIADTDMAKTISDYQQNTTRLNAAQLAMAHQNTLLQQTVGRLLG